MVDMKHLIIPLFSLSLYVEVICFVYLQMAIYIQTS